VRIISGSMKGRRLEAPDWEGLRPTSDKLRETLFNILSPRIEGARLLDGYAGTGAVGIEAVSRGAAHVTFVERDGRGVRLIERNVARAGVEGDRHVIIRAGVAAAMPRLSAQRFDIIFLDPPYGAREATAALRAVEPLAGDDTLVILEHARRDAAPERAGRLVRTRDVPSGDSALSFYRVTHD
jgi:16S rRNA (guanine(966)-N(2))-methyltransferase RsmD